MNRYRYLQYVVLLGFVLSIAAVLFAQSGPNRTLLVNGKAVDARITQINGRSYVDIETLAKITNGTVTIEPSRIVLTIPASNPGAAPLPAPEGLSRNFASAAITVLAEMREWRGAIGTILTLGAPVVGTWPKDYHDRAEASLMQVAVAASTASDQQALQLLRNEFANITAWANDVVGTRQAMNATKTVDPTLMQNDLILAKISDCSRLLGVMIVSGAFADYSSCH